MATTEGKKKLPSKVGVSRSDYPIPPLPVVVAPVRESFGEDVMGWIAACVLVALMLPVLGMLYLDVLEAKHAVKAEVEKVERLRREIEREKRDKKPSNSISDDPLLDRVRRPFSLHMPRPNQLE